MLKYRINFIYLLFIPLLFFVYQANKNWSNDSLLFYGFAENKETEINLDKDVLVGRIYVTTGEEVVKGQLLMEVSHAAIDLKINDAGLDIKKVEATYFQEQQTIKDKIAQLEAQKIKKQSLIQNEIEQIQKTISLNRSLLNDLKSMDLVEEKKISSSHDLKIDFLEKKLSEELNFLDLQILQAKTTLKAISRPSKIVKQQLEKEIDYHKKEQDKLKIYAPSDGLIGNIHCKEGEHFDAFSTLLSFYERNPTLVKGFVHESMILQVKVGDELKVASSLHRNHQIDGIVAGLGSRIVEIPERLRKIPEFKTYGREVLIQIPESNPFLQKEKVLLKSFIKEGDLAGLSFLFPKNIFSEKGKVAME